MKETLKEITHEFDSNTGRLLVNLETLRNIETELGTISEDIRNTKFENYAYLLNDIDHKIHLLSDLLHYCLKDFNETYEHTRIIKESYFDLLVRNGGGNEGVHEYPYYETVEEAFQQKKENTPNSTKNQG